MLIAGVDEVGRGPLAGPVIAAAVILAADIPGVTDSKKLSEKKREQLFAVIKSQAVCYALGRVEPQEIDAINIHNASLLAMQRAIEGLEVTPDKVLVDGLYTPNISISMPSLSVKNSNINMQNIVTEHLESSCNEFFSQNARSADLSKNPEIIYEAIVKGDSLINAIGAASILAKVTRDREMIEMDSKYPGYNFSKHKGYPTKEHKNAIAALGLSAIHRQSFRCC